MNDGNGDKSADPPESFITELRNLMNAWRWTPKEIESALPKLVRILVELGILRQNPDGTYEPTERVQDEAAWTEAWARAEKEGIAGSEPAS